MFKAYGLWLAIYFIILPNGAGFETKLSTTGVRKNTPAGTAVKRSTGLSLLLSIMFTVARSTPNYPWSKLICRLFTTGVTRVKVSTSTIRRWLRLTPTGSQTVGLSAARRRTTLKARPAPPLRHPTRPRSMRGGYRITAPRLQLPLVGCFVNI
jgi:hypothetical protein